MWCSYHKETSHNKANCRVQQRKVGGNAHAAAARIRRLKGVYSVYDLSEEDDEPERPYIVFTATEIQSKTESTPAPTQSNGTWPFGRLTGACPWSFVEREKPGISLGGQIEPDLSYMYGGTDGEGEPLYGTALIASEPAAFKQKPSAGDDSVTALVNSGAFGHYFDDLPIPSLKHRLLNDFVLTTPRNIVTAGIALLDGTAEGILQGLVTDSNIKQYLARITVLIVPGIGCNLFYIKSATKKGVDSIFNFDNPRLEFSGINISLRAAHDNLYSLVFDLSAYIHGKQEAGDKRDNQRTAVAPPAGTPQPEKLGAHAEA